MKPDGTYVTDTFEQKARTTKITATSRASVKIKDSYYTLEYSEERVIPDLPDVDIETERAVLWQVVNNEVDQQISDTVYAVTGKR